jgi:hypothetical protein
MLYNHDMAEEFKLTADFSELRKMKKDFKFKRPSQVIAAIRTTLNDQSFLTMRVAKQFTLPQKFNIRSRFVQNSVRVKKATGRNVAAMQALTGSTFPGMRDQELGASRSNEEISTTASRVGGTFKKKVRTANRFNRLADIERADRFKGNSPEHRITVMLRTLAAQNFKGAMFIRRSKKFKTGIYKFKGRARRARTGGVFKPIVMIKDLSKPSVRIPKRPWLLPSTKRGANKNMSLKLWRRNAKRFTTKTK